MKKKMTMAQIAREANRMAKHYFKNPYQSSPRREDADVLMIEGKIYANAKKNK
jgi:hypothetical protein